MCLLGLGGQVHVEGVNADRKAGEEPHQPLHLPHSLLT